ncbi:hypothetical protein BpHYR1_044644 [Brachionus plicatilis]|uniref:Uncharacterized protein n=1 Tax=Brachionus plicatilis TaxID=10195 RepID=A0A3M7T650_BRAPC|nr:hypothetical protein BpHYR1_044644 [Brachionus plicatilis]
MLEESKKANFTVNFCLPKLKISFFHPIPKHAFQLPHSITLIVFQGSLHQAPSGFYCCTLWIKFANDVRAKWQVIFTIC